MPRNAPRVKVNTTGFKRFRAGQRRATDRSLVKAARATLAQIIRREKRRRTGRLLASFVIDGPYSTATGRAIDIGNTQPYSLYQSQAKYGGKRALRFFPLGLRAGRRQFREILGDEFQDLLRRAGIGRT